MLYASIRAGRKTEDSFFFLLIFIADIAFFLSFAIYISHCCCAAICQWTSLFNCISVSVSVSWLYFSLVFRLVVLCYAMRSALCYAMLCDGFVFSTLFCKKTKLNGRDRENDSVSVCVCVWIFLHSVVLFFVTFLRVVDGIWSVVACLESPFILSAIVIAFIVNII